MDLELFRRRALENALRKAVAAGSIDVVYQPIIDPSGTRAIAAETLARWSDPLLGPIRPDLFIPLAEEGSGDRFCGARLPTACIGPASTSRSVILASIVKLGLGLRMTITAEGVETPEQLRVLRDFGCHQIQGYLFSRPLTAGQFTLFLAAHQPIAAAG